MSVTESHQKFGSTVFSIQQVLKDGSKIQIRTITLIHWEEFFRNVVQEFFRSDLNMQHGSSTTTGIHTRDCTQKHFSDRHPRQTLQCEGSSHLPDFSQQYMKLRLQASWSWKQWGEYFWPWSTLPDIYTLADNTSLLLAATTTSGPTGFVHPSTVQVSPGNGEMLLQH